jgi:hypothetical protein
MMHFGRRDVSEVPASGSASHRVHYGVTPSCLSTTSVSQKMLSFVIR